MEVFSQVVAKNKIPTMGDISAVLGEVAPPGQDRDEKIKRIKELFSQLGISSSNTQGHAVWEDLDNYPEF